ncbi:hypothetical protein RHGRI_037434 [Rhododendron griersonianum]|uniref:Uncharacterized protein n=1 Tax=Rhododendron griersonianum TaxID=479676 RepID=A0AAV6HVN8_9ERIC|nr:hypothetical protein RHGRI_037434 [Rhododendron griersonianum]
MVEQMYKEETGGARWTLNLHLKANLKQQKVISLDLRIETKVSNKVQHLYPPSDMESDNTSTQSTIAFPMWKWNSYACRVGVSVSCRVLYAKKLKCDLFDLSFIICNLLCNCQHKYVLHFALLSIVKLDFTEFA